VSTITAERYAAAAALPEYIEATRKNTEFWRGTYRTARLDDDARARAANVHGTWRLFALSEDWCGDAVNTLPVVAKLVEAMGDAELRVVGRDANPDVMAAHLTNGTRSIPVVILLDDQWIERGWWGPRPSELQALYLTELRLLEKEERNRRVRTWYARDRGRSTARELLDLVERAARGSPQSLAGH
jgi:hypothetical protein